MEAKEGRRRCIAAEIDFTEWGLTKLPVCQSRPFLGGHARINGRLGKIASFLPFFFVILPISL